jgi:dGTPase
MRELSTRHRSAACKAKLKFTTLEMAIFFYRTRLTHSLEVAQIAGGVTQHLEATNRDHPAYSHLPPKSLIQTAGFSHDLGHPPFGHGGETALNYCMRDAGGFEGNGQTLRLLSKLEHFSISHGSNLTRRALLALLKYPVPYSTVVNPAVASRLASEPFDNDLCRPPKCFLDTEKGIVDWILLPLSAQDRATFQSFESEAGAHGGPMHKSFDCSIMDIADDIAYGVHDLEDAIALGLVGESHFREYIGIEDYDVLLNGVREREGEGITRQFDSHDAFTSSLFGSGNDRKRAIGHLVNHLIIHIDIATVETLTEPLIRYRAVMRGPQARLLEKLKKLVWVIVIRSPAVQAAERQGQGMVLAVFDALQSQPKLLPNDQYAGYVRSGGDLRIICDYVAGMTDGFLRKTYSHLTCS